MVAENKKNKNKYIIDKVTRSIFLICALIAVISLVLIIGFVFYKGLRPFFAEGKSFTEFIFGTEWYPTSENQKYGILPMIIASIYGTIGALIIGVPIGLLTAIFIAEVAPKGLSKIIIPAVELLAGIPSVLYGLFGLAVIVPWIQNTFNLPQGQSLLAVIIVLAVMMLPTIISVSTTAIKAVPKSYKEGSLALGASHIETTFKVVGLRPFFAEGKSFTEFIFGTEWYPTSENQKYGILPMIIASIYGTIGALIIGVPIGLLTAIFIAEVAPKGLSKIIIPAVELLAGIPSVLYGLFGLAVIVPWIQNTFNLPQGQSLLAVIIVLAVMMLPTIISVSTTAIKAVPKSYKEGSLALGASHIETTFKVVVPAAKSGILAAVVLGCGRAIGETMAIILVGGNSVQIPTSIFDKVRPLWL